MNQQGLKLSVYFGDSLVVGTRLASDVLMDIFARHRLTVAVLFRGVEGFGIGRRIHTASFPDISVDLPLVATATDTREHIEAVLEDVDCILDRGLITLEHVRLVTDQDVAEAEIPTGLGRAAKLTIYCGRGDRVGATPAYRAIVNLLRRQGSAGATVLLGVDGFYRHSRERARLFTRNANVPMAIVVLGSVDVLEPVLALLGGLVPQAVINLETVSLVKHDGELLEPLPTLAAPDGRIPEIWQMLNIYTRQSALVRGRSLYAELTRRLRMSGAAGVTTVLGEWGFSSDEAPHGGKVWTPASHVPTYTLYVDRPQKVAEVWPILDEVTAEHGIVTSQFVPAYRERVGEVVQGRLDVAEQTLFPPPYEHDAPLDPPATHDPAPATLIDPVAYSDEERWLKTFASEAAEFARSRGRPEPIVRITLADGEQFFLASAESRPGGGFVTLYPHPTLYSDLVEAIGGDLVSARALVVPLASITKIELLRKVPRGSRSLLGFHLPSEQ